MNNELISIIIPVFNSEKYLKKCLNSVIKQSYENIEIIIVNDGSEDNSLSICNEFKEKDDRIKIINKENEGVSIARNIGIKESTGKYIQFVDSDDFLELDTCKILYENIKTFKADLVICGLKIYKNDILLRTPHLEKRELKINEKFENYKFVLPILASPCNKLYIKNLLCEKFNNHISLGEDFINNLNYLRKSNLVVTIPECLYNVCLDNEYSLNRKFDLERLDKVLFLKKVEENFIKEIYKNDYDENYINCEYILAIHAFFRKVCEVKNKKKFIELLEFYLNKEDIKKHLDKCNFDRIDYKIFNYLCNKNFSELIYIFFKIKIMLKKHHNYS